MELSRKDDILNWPIDFQNHGFSPAERPIHLDTITNLAADPLRLLEPYSLLKFEFCSYWDEAIELHQEQNDFVAFGSCVFGVFVVDNKKAIRLYSLDNIAFEERFVYTNNNFATFVSSYSSFIAAVFIQKSYLNLTNKGSDEAVKLFRARIENIESEALADGTFWNQMLYMLDDGLITIRPPVLKYIEDGRVKEK